MTFATILGALILTFIALLLLMTAYILTDRGGEGTGCFGVIAVIILFIIIYNFIN